MQTTRTPPEAPPVIDPGLYRILAFHMAKLAQVEDAWLGLVERPFNTERFKRRAITVTRNE